MKRTRFILTIAVACLAATGQVLAQKAAQSPFTFVVPVTLQDMPPEVAGLEVSCDLTNRADPNFPKLIAVVSSMAPQGLITPGMGPPWLELKPQIGYSGNVTVSFVGAGTPTPTGSKPGAPITDPNKVNWAGATHYQCKLFLYGPKPVAGGPLMKPGAAPPPPTSIWMALREAASPLSQFSWARPKPGSSFTLDTQPVPIPQS